MSARKPSLLIIFLTVFIDLIGFGIVLPLLPRYSERFGAQGFMIGLIIASFSVMQFFLAPAWGRLSDRIGRRPVLLLSNAGSAVSYALFAWAASPAWSATTALGLILLSRVFAGACGANISVASAYIADVTPPEKRSKGMAIIGVAFGLGFILGPAIGAWSAGRFGLAGPGWMAGLLCATNFTMACFILVESRKPGSAPATRRVGLEQWKHVLSRPRAGLLVWLYFLATFCFACFESTLPLLVGSPKLHPDDIVDPVALARKLNADSSEVAQRLRANLPERTRELLASAEDLTPAEVRRGLFESLNDALTTAYLVTPTNRVAVPGTNGKPAKPDARANRVALERAFPEQIRPQRLYFDESRIGYIFAFCGLIATFVQGGVGRLVKRMGEARLIVASLALFAVSLALLPQMLSLTGLLVALALISAGSGINRAPTLGLLSRLTPAEEQGATLGVAQSASTLGRIFGPVFATSLYSLHPHGAYLAAAGIAFFAAGLALAKLRQRPGGTLPTGGEVA